MPFRHVCLLLFVLLSANQGVASTERQTPSSVIGDEFTYAVRKGDSLTFIGSRFGVSERALARDNGLRPPYRLKIGDRLKVDNRHLIPEVLPEGVVIILKDVHRVALVLRGGGVGYYPRSNFVHVDIGRVRSW